jgi:hypothetical protein
LRRNNLEYVRKEASDEGQIFGQTDVRKVQGHQEKGFDPHYLRKPEAQAETGLIKSAAL